MENTLQKLFELCEFDYTQVSDPPFVINVIKNNLVNSSYIVKGLTLDQFNDRTVKINEGYFLVRDFKLTKVINDKFISLDNDFNYFQFDSFTYEDTFFIGLDISDALTGSIRFVFVNPSLYNEKDILFLGACKVKDSKIIGIYQSVNLSSVFFKRRYFCTWLSDRFGFTSVTGGPGTGTQVNGACFVSNVSNFSEGQIVHGLNSLDLTYSIIEGGSNESVIPDMFRIIDQNTVYVRFIPAIQQASIIIQACDRSLSRPIILPIEPTIPPIYGV